MLLINFDGACKENPGKIGAAAVIYEDGRVIAEVGEFDGAPDGTNNIAEYRGLIIGLKTAAALNRGKNVSVEGDSKLVIEQVIVLYWIRVSIDEQLKGGGYAVKNDKLKLLHTEAINVITSHSLKVVSYNWIPREKNIVADLLSNMAIKQEKDFSYISLPIKDQKKWYNKAAADPMKHVARFRASVTNSFKIKNLDGSTKPQPGDRIDVTWHSDIEDRKYTDISIKLMDAESLSIYELAFPHTSPQTPDYCLVNEKYTHTKKPSIDLNVLWSVVILRQREGTCGSGLWDFEMDVIESELTNYQTPVPKPAISSNNEHRPRPVMKRSINFAAAETPFPPHSGLLSFSQVVEFAHQSQTAINHTFAVTERAKRRKGASNLVLDHILPALDDPRTSFSLPLVTPHRLNQRFAVAQDNSVFTVFRKSYTALKTAFLEMDTDIYPGFLLRGPVGVGKSHILYILVAEYRLLRSTYRVTYIHDCAEWKIDKFGYILRELVMTFFDDKDISGKDIVEWCSAIVESDKEEKMMMMLNALIVYIQTKNLQWIIVCDQYNAFYSRSVVVDQFPFTIIDYLSKKRGSNIKVIISASANNEGFPTELRNWFTHDIASHKFDDDEFGAWCKYFPLKSGKTIDPKSDEALDALYWTGGVPYELFLLWAQPEASLVDKTRKYRKNRMIEMGSSHGKFCDTLTAEKMLNLKECIARIALGLPCPDLLVGRDDQLFDVTLQPKRGRCNEFLNPVARRTLITYYGQGLLSPLALVTELILKGNYTQDIKSQISAKYLIVTMEVSKKFSFEYKVKTQTGLSKDAPRKQSVELLEIVRFIGHEVPPTASFNPNRSTLFVPESVNYPGYDFFIWNSKTKTISAFQVTIRNPFYNHTKIDSTSAQQNCAHWMTYCSAKSSEVYWVTPKSCLGGKSKKAEGNLVVLFESISKRYPALDHLTL